MHAVDRKLIQILAKTPQLILFLNRFSIQPYIQKYSFIYEELDGQIFSHTFFN